jgi:hypothetical protein
LKVELWESSNKVFFSQITQMAGIHHVNFSVRSWVGNLEAVLCMHRSFHPLRVIRSLSRQWIHLVTVSCFHLMKKFNYLLCLIISEETKHECVKCDHIWSTIFVLHFQ